MCLCTQDRLWMRGPCTLFMLWFFFLIGRRDSTLPINDIHVGTPSRGSTQRIKTIYAKKKPTNQSQSYINDPLFVSPGMHTQATSVHREPSTKLIPIRNSDGSIGHRAYVVSVHRQSSAQPMPIRCVGKYQRCLADQITQTCAPRCASTLKKTAVPIWWN